MNPLSLISAGLGVGSLINSFVSAGKLNRMANAIHPADPTYAVSPYAKDRLGLAETLLNARMPGAASLERNIEANQAAAGANIDRNATSSAEALTMKAQAQGQTNQADANLATQEQQDFYNRLGNLSNAQQGMVAEGDKVYQDKLRDYQEQQQLKNAYMGAAMQDQQQAWNSLANTGIAAASMAMMPKQPALPFQPGYGAIYGSGIGVIPNFNQ
jgi:hypothetical protein